MCFISFHVFTIRVPDLQVHIETHKHTDIYVFRYTTHRDSIAPSTFYHTKKHTPIHITLSTHLAPHLLYKFKPWCLIVAEVKCLQDRIHDEPVGDMIRLSTPTQAHGAKSGANGGAICTTICTILVQKLGAKTPVFAPPYEFLHWVFALSFCIDFPNVSISAVLMILSHDWCKKLVQKIGAKTFFMVQKLEFLHQVFAPKWCKSWCKLHHHLHHFLHHDFLVVATCKAKAAMQQPTAPTSKAATPTSQCTGSSSPTRAWTSKCYTQWPQNSSQQTHIWSISLIFLVHPPVW